jgi:hypothetical protein
MELIRRGVQFGRNNELERGILCLFEGLSLIDESRDPRLALSAFHNLALFFAHLGLTVLARGVIVRARRLYRDLGDPVMDARLTWLQGTVARFANDFELAKSKLRQAAEQFESLGQNEQASQVNEELEEMTELQGVET